VRNALPLPYPPVPAVSVETELMCYRASRYVIFVHSSSGIMAGVGVGTIVVVVTSHSYGQIEECGPHFVVENLRMCAAREIETGEGTRFYSRALSCV